MQAHLYIQLIEHSSFSASQHSTIQQAACCLSTHGWYCLDIQGRSWNEGAVIVGAQLVPSTPDPFSLALLVPTSTTAKQATDAPKTGTTTSNSSQDLQLTVTMPKAISWGETASASLEVVSIKGKAGGSPAELTLDPLTPAALAAGGATSAILLHGALMRHATVTYIHGMSSPCAQVLLTSQSVVQTSNDKRDKQHHMAAELSDTCRCSVTTESR